MSATTSAWSEEKPKHVRDVALALRARVRFVNCASLEECEWFRDIEKFTTLSKDIMSTHNRVPARSFHHTERFRNMVRREYSKIEAQDDIAHTATSPPPRSPSAALTSPRPRRRAQRRKSTSRRARAGDWVAPLKVLGMAILFGAFGLMVFFSGVLVCDLCQENFERLAGTRTENATSGNDTAPQ